MEPDVPDLESSEICPDNHTTCIGDNIDAVLEVFDAHHNDKDGVQPDWGKTFIESLFCKRSVNRPFGRS